MDLLLHYEITSVGKISDEIDPQDDNMVLLAVLDQVNHDQLLTDNGEYYLPKTVEAGGVVYNVCSDEEDWWLESPVEAPKQEAL